MIGQTQKSILKSAMNRERFPVMVKKLKRRLFDKKSSIDNQSYKRWLVENATPVDQWCEETDEKLWEETLSFVNSLFERWEKIKQDLPDNMGGNACVKLLYFLARRYQPETIVETGVALGFSSQSFLTAMKLNGHGKLYSSDFPYVRLSDAEKYIGIMVEEKLKCDWALHIKGDEINLPKIMRDIDKIDLFHYDSDKSYEGRQKGFQIVKEKMTDDTVIIFDDIEDNPHFYDFIQTNKITDWQVLENRGGFIGMINSRRMFS